jgi:surfactin family lipopeptide synthetase A
MANEKRQMINDKREDIQERSNLTRSQLLFWAGQKLRPADPLYNMAVCYSIRTDLDIQQLQSAWLTLVNSSDALRTVIEEHDGVPMQTVLPRIDHELEFVDLSGQDASGWIHERSRMIFDLGKRLFDGAVIKVEDQEFIIYINSHQIIGDAWATNLIYRRLSELYDGDAPEFPPFQTYVDFERENRGSTRYQKSEAYWKQQLHEPANDMRLYGQAPGATTRGRRLTTPLDRERVERLKARSREVFVGTPDLSLFVLFVSIFFAWLSLLSGARRLSLGIMHHNRVTKSFADTIGMFTETLPLRITIAGDETFRTLIRRVTSGVLDSLKHGQFTTGNPIQNANYHVSFNYINASLPEFHGAPVSAEWVHTGYQNEMFDLHVRQWNSAGDLVMEFDLDSDLFSEDEQREAMRHFALIMDAAAADLDAAIDHGLLMDESQKARFAALLSEASFAFESEATA